MVQPCTLILCLRCSASIASSVRLLILCLPESQYRTLLGSTSNAFASGVCQCWPKRDSPVERSSSGVIRPLNFHFCLSYCFPEFDTQFHLIRYHDSCSSSKLNAARF